MPALPSYMLPTSASKARAATRPCEQTTRPKVKAQAKTVKQQAARPQAKQQVKTRSGKPSTVKPKAQGTTIQEEEQVTFAPAVETVAAVCLDESEWDLDLIQHSIIDESDAEATVVNNKLSELDSTPLVDASLFAVPVTRAASEASLQSGPDDESILGLPSMSMTMEQPTETFIAIEASRSPSMCSASVHDSVMDPKSNIDSESMIASAAVSVSTSLTGASFSALSTSALARIILQVSDQDAASPPQQPTEDQDVVGYESCPLIGEGRLFSPFHSSFLARQQQQQQQAQPLPTVADLLWDLTSEVEYTEEEGVMMPERPEARQGFYGQEAESSSDGGLADVISALEKLSVPSDEASFALDDIITGRAAVQPPPEDIFLFSICPSVPFVPKQREMRQVIDCRYWGTFTPALPPLFSISQMPANPYSRKS